VAGNLNYAETLKVLLEPYLPRGYPPALLAASLMKVSVRTQARRLSELGMTYRALIDQTRFQTARLLLRDTDMKIIEVAAAVGFDDASNFARMFRRVGGLSPCEFRRQVLAEERAWSRRTAAGRAPGRSGHRRG
jgi:AraC-like DNA-binding protein